MSAQTISLRLPEEEVAILNLLSDRERRTKTQIIREALQPLFRKVLDEPERITLRKLFKSTLNNRLHSNLACVIDKSSRVAKLKRAFEELP